MSPARFTREEFLSAAVLLAAEQGPFSITVSSITKRLKAPIGSFYHRFESRDALVAELWLEIAAELQQGVAAALKLGDALLAALHTPMWARARPDEARLFLLYHPDDLFQGSWPEALRGEATEHTERKQADLAMFAQLAFGRVEPDDLWRAQFLLSEVPAAAVSQHLRRREPPPPRVDEFIALTYRALVADVRSEKGAALD
jgi:AcrR family transcriptional regulator